MVDYFGCEGAGGNDDTVSNVSVGAQRRGMSVDWRPLRRGRRTGYWQLKEEGATPRSLKSSVACSV